MRGRILLHGSCTFIACFCFYWSFLWYFFCLVISYLLREHNTCIFCYISIVLVFSIILVFLDVCYLTFDHFMLKVAPYFFQVNSQCFYGGDSWRCIYPPDNADRCPLLRLSWDLVCLWIMSLHSWNWNKKLSNDGSIACAFGSFI